MDRGTVTSDHGALLKRAYDTIEVLEAKLARSERARREPIAVVGVGLRLPGGVSDLDGAWQMLRDGVDAITEVPRNRWDVDEFFDPDPDVPGKMCTRWGGFLDQIDEFDARFFGISPREAAAMDPQQRLLLEVGWEALEHAGYATPDTTDRRTGVFIGMVGADYSELRRGNIEALDGHLSTGTARSIAAGRLSYTFGLSGPSMAVDTACSSSAVATHLAALSLRTGECDLAIAGGVNLIIVPDGFVVASRGRMLSPTGRCQTFDAAADGYVRAEGCVLFVLKRLSDAVSARDNILGVILGSAVNQDGRSNGITAPNGRAQEALLRTALAESALAPEAIGYIEAHGTGTSLGDPIEVRALGSVFSESHSRERPLMLGSVKTNLGHLEGAAGAAGMLKLMLALQHRAIPPHLHLHQPNPHLPWESLPVTVPTELTPWPARDDRPRIGGVSSFGFSGTNSHIILAEPPVVSPVELPAGGSRVVALSAKTAEALSELAGSVARKLAGTDATLADVALSANTGRLHWPERLAVVATSTPDLVEKLSAWHGGEQSPVVRGNGARIPEVAFLFTGQGAQYARMGRGLYDSAPAFRSALDCCARGLDAARREMTAAGLGGAAASDPVPLLDVMFAEEGTANAVLLDQTGYTQPALFALEYALASQWQEWGIRPAVVLGHSVGELVAATVAGLLPLDDALRLVTARGLLLQGLPTTGPNAGGMLSVIASEREVTAVLADQSLLVREAVEIAAVNGPARVVLAGAVEPLANMAAALERAGYMVQPLRVSHAFHSPLVAPVLEPFARVADTMRFGSATVPIVSNVTGELGGTELQSAAYWVRHVRAAVRFAAGMETLRGVGCTAYLEIGPKPTLLGLVQELPGAALPSIPSLRAGRDELAQMQESLATLYTLGAELDWMAIERDGGGRRVALPTYPFQRQRHWLNIPGMDETGRARRVEHPLLHERLRSPRLSGTVFQSTISAASPPYLTDHRISEMPLFPAAGFVEMAWAAGRRLSGMPVVVDQIQIRDALVLPESETVTVQLLLDDPGDGTTSFEICSSPTEGEWTVHAQGRIRADGDPRRAVQDTLVNARARCTEPLPVEEFYERLAGSGAAYGPAFQGVQEIWRRDGEAVARIKLPESSASDADRYELHPALLDACIQLIGATFPVAMEDAGEIYVPVDLNVCALRKAGSASLWCHAVTPDLTLGAEVLTGVLRLYQDDGTLIGGIEAVRLRRITPDASARMRRGISNERLAEWLYALEWENSATPAQGRSDLSGQWLIMADRQGVGDELAERIDAAGGTAAVITGGTERGAENELLTEAIAEARAHGRGFTGIVHLSSLDSAGDCDPLVQQRRTCGGVLAMVQMLVHGGVAVGGLWLVTRGAQHVRGHQATVDPVQSPLWGLANTITAEHPELGCRCVDLDPGRTPDSVAVLMSELLAGDAEDRVAWRAGRRLAARLGRLPRDNSPPTSLPEPVELEITERGVLDNLVLRSTTRRPPRAGEVEVAVRATGLNFRDVLNALGMYPGPAGPVGNECAGTVIAVGDGVTSVAVGDEVMALGSGTFRSHLVTAAHSVYRKPVNLTHAEAASIPIAFLTAHYGLHVLAGIRKGDRVLIHAAAGGVGLSAVQLALLAGAEVIGSAGSAQKQAFLKSIGVRHVVSSRTPDFEDDVMRVTEGRGVDIVLNSLADEFIPRSMAVLADGGCFLEIGKRGVWTAERVRELNPTLRYHLYDLADIIVPSPEYVASAFDTLVPMFENGTLWPLPLQVFPLDAAAEAFRFMAQAKHTGKIVVTQQPLSPRAPPVVRDDASYLITGGLGGIGLVVAEWLVDRGARNLVLMGRHAPGDQARAMMRSLGERGARVVPIEGDVSRAEDVERVVSWMEAEMPPLRGIVHSAGVLDDGVLLQQSMDRFDTVMLPKIRGAWNLHLHSRALPLDFFLLFSTGSVHLGAAGQGNYAAANAYLDGLAHFRHTHGLPATAINWGPWSEVGMAADMAGRDQRRWRAAGLSFISPAEGVRALEHLLVRQPAQAAVLPFDWSKYQRQNGSAPSRRFLCNLAVAAATPARGAASPGRGTSALREQLRTAGPDAAREMLWTYVRDLVVKVLALDPKVRLDPEQGLTELGMDSLMAVELSNHLQASVGVKLSSTVAFEYPTLAALTEFLCESLLDAVSVLAVAPPAGNIPAPENSEPALPSELENASEAELEATLLAELNRAGY